MKKTICLLLLVAIMLLIPSLTLAVTINSIEYQDDIDEGTYDIIGNINENEYISTTYDYEGYQVYFKVGDIEVDDIYDYISGSIIENGGMELTITSTPTADNKSVNVIYNVKNTSEEEKQYAIATIADTELADNDCAAMYKDETSIIQITQDNDEDYEDNYRTQIKIAFSPVATTTWIGYYDYNYDNRYINGEVTSYTFDDDEDTGLAFSWSGTLAAGEETSYTATFTIQEAKLGTVNFYKIGEEEPSTILNGLVGGSVLTPAASEETELGYKHYWNTKKDGTGTDYGAEKGIIITSEEMNLYEVRKSLWHDIIIRPTNGMNIEEDEEFGLLELLLENGILKYEEKPEEDSIYIYSKDGKLLFKVNEEGILTLAEGLTYKDNIEYVLTDAERVLLAEEEFFINKISLIFENPPEPVEYKILDGAGQKHEIGDGKDIVVKTNGDIKKLKELKVDNQTLGEDNYTIEAGSTIATLKTAYLDTLPEGDHILTFVYEDGDVSTNFTIAKKPVVEEEPVVEEVTTLSNPQTGDPIVYWAILMVVSISGMVVTKKVKNK